MAVGYNPSIVLDDLTFLIDAQSEKGFGSDDFTKARTRIIDNPGDRDAGEDVIVKHSQGPFPGAGYVSFDGQGNHTQLDAIYTSSLSADFDLSGNISSTVECWVYLTAYPGTSTSSDNPQYSGASVFSLKNTNGTYNYYHLAIGTTGTIGMGADAGAGSGSTGASTSTVPLNTWVHIAWVRDSGSNRFFLNGTEITSEFSTPNASNMVLSGNARISIGADYYAASSLNWLRPLTGYISNFRLVKGTALYTSNFTPTGNSLTAVTNTKLLTCQKGTITNSSSSGHSLSSNGDPTAVYPSLGSYVFDGTQNTKDQKIQFSSSLFNSNSNFTLSMWYEASSTSDLISNTSGAGLSVELGTRVMIQEPYGGGQLTYTASNTVVTLDQIYNVVITRNGQTTTSFSVFVNGEEVSVSNINDGGAEIFAYHPNVIGSRYNGGSTPAAHFQGKLYHMCAYQRVLTDSEIKQNFNALKGRYGV